MSRQVIAGFVIAGLAIAGLGLRPAAGLDANSPAPGGELAFDLKEISVFRLDELGPAAKNASVGFLDGHRGWCQNAPLAEVFYPKLRSKKPLYGSVEFVSRRHSESELRISYAFVIDESRGTGKGYDFLYFDTNHDRDLTNDSPVRSLKDPPKQALSVYPADRQQVCFETLDVLVSLDRETARPIKFLSRLGGLPNLPYLSLVTLQVHTGTVKIGGESFTALLGHSGPVGGWFDDPHTALRLVADKGQEPGWSGGDRLMAIRGIAGTLYRFSCSPAGDRLTARPVTCPFGTLKAGPGARNLPGSEVTMQGSVRSKEALLGIGEVDGEGQTRPTTSWRLPAGDYQPYYLRVHMGSLDIEVSDNPHSDGRPRDRGARPYKYGIQIRPDRPFVFEFSNKPEVMFASPAQDLTVQRGATLEVKAVLVDPNLDIMIRGLRYGNGNDVVPSVVVTRQGGEIVGKGTMPFG